jgi:hypothetical protein
MSFFLNEDQEIKLNQFLDRENRKVCEEQLQGDEVPPEFKELIQKTIESDSPLPFFDPRIGYFSVSFTPIEDGTRIYAHHHLSGVSEAIHDPSRVDIIDETEREEIEEDSDLGLIETEVLPPEQDTSIGMSLTNMKSEYAFSVPQMGEDGTYNPPRD